MKEISYQRQIVKSVKRSGGLARKQNHTTMVGVPDLIIWVPRYSPVEVEVKLIKDCTPGFKRKLDVTQKQTEKMRNVCELYEANMAFVLVIIEWRGSRVVSYSPMPFHTKTIDNQTCTMYNRGDNQFFDMKKIMELMKVPQLELRG